MKDVHHLKPLALFFYIAKVLYKTVGKLKKRPFFSNVQLNTIKKLFSMSEKSQCEIWQYEFSCQKNGLL